MISALFQLVLLIAAGVVLFRLWRAIMPSQRWLRLVIVWGFVTRALIGQALFWISWTGLPIARSMQLGNGLWFFGSDGEGHFANAVAAATTGWWGIPTVDRTVQSMMYVQLFAIALWLFGRVVSVAVLLNLFCYVGTIGILVFWSRREPRTGIAVAVATTAISVSPAFLLWTLQPLKDSLFQLLYVAFIACCAAWQKAWLAPTPPLKRIGVGAMLIALIFVLAATRWYFALLLLAVTPIFLFWTVARTPARRLMAFLVALVVALSLFQALVGGAGHWLPEPIAAAFTHRTSLEAIKSLPSSLKKRVEYGRTALDRAGGGTVIRVGMRLERARAENAPAVPGPGHQKANSRTARVSSGIAAIILPRSVGQWLGLFHISGGRGILWVTEIDTILFDLVLLFATVVLTARFRVAYRDPLTWLIVVLTLLLGVLLAYTVGNFGTLFRYREMVYLGWLLAPIAAVSASSERVRSSVNAGGESPAQAGVC